MTTRRAAYAYGRWNRQRKLRILLEFAAGHDAKTLLCVGVKSGSGPVANIVERGLEASHLDVTMSGLGKDEPGWSRYVTANGLDLPFGAGEFDIVFSNAVIEHVGGADAQRRFLAEHSRVGRHWMATTPNRLFPVEAHTHTLFRHWSRAWEDPRPSQSVTRLLSRADLHAILPGGVVHGWLGPTLIARSSRR